MEYTRKVFYYETDQMGIVHHSNYIRWFEEARLDALEKLGYPYARMEEEGIISPVLGVECDYLKMVHYGDTVNIEVLLEDIKPIKFAFSYIVRDAITGEIKSKGKSRHCFLDKSGAPLAIKKAFPDLYEKMISMKNC